MSGVQWKRESGIFCLKKMKDVLQARPKKGKIGG